MRTTLTLVGICLAVLVAVLVVRTPFLAPAPIQLDPVTDIPVDSQAVINRLQKAIRIKTISYPDPENIDHKAFLAFHEYLSHEFPKTHETLTKETVGQYSLIFTWPGQEKNLKPILFLAHLDVVPVEPGTLQGWRYPPFSGHIADGFIWGRGAIDDKARVVGMLEAVEMLLKKGFVPRRTLMFAFGHDEEIGGLRGAQKIAELMHARGVDFECIFDEGGIIITEGLLPNVSQPISLIGIAEKGYLTLELHVRTPGGHSSMPPSKTAVGILSSAIHRLESQPFPSRLDGATRKLFEYLAHMMPWGQRLVLSNLWLFEPLVKQKLLLKATTNAIIRSTVAVTMFHGGVKENVLPAEARAVVNLRLLPGDTIEATMGRFEDIIDDPRISVQQIGQAYEASAVSSTESWGFKMLERTLGQIFTDVTVAPSLVPVTTDSRHYTGLGEDMYRFTPIMISTSNLTRIHGINERISVENYTLLVKFYYQLFRNTDMNPA